MTSRRWWIATLALAQLALAEWFRSPGLLLAAVTIVLTLASAVLLARGRWGERLLALLLLAQAVIVGLGQHSLRQVQTSWPTLRERRIVRAAERWERDLQGARVLVESLAERASEAADRDQTQERAFDRLARLVGPEQLEVGVAILEADGTPFSWAGRHRLPPEIEGDSIDFRATPYYAIIESRRHLANSRTVVTSALLAADSSVPDQARSLARRFEEANGVGLVILPPGVAPDTSDVFDYVEPTTAGPRLLFSVQLTPPSQSAAFLAVEARLIRRLVGLGLAIWVVALMVAPAGWPRLVLAALPVAATLRAPLGEALGAPTLFSPMTFFQPLLGPVSRAAGPLALVGGLVLTLGLVWHDRRRTSGWWGAPIAFVLVLGAPFLVSRIGRGIQVPAEGVSAPLWLIWQLAVFAAAAALLVIAASLLPAPKGKGRVWTAVAGAAIGVVTAVVGVLIWNARHGWPDWYPVLWSIALGLVIWPGRRRAMLAGLAVATGAAAALMTWGAEVESRVAAARADLATLGDRADPIAVPLLDEFIDQAELGAVPRTASELFALWRAAPLSRQGFPAALALWGPDGSPLAALRLDEVDLPDSLVARQVAELAPEQARRIEPLQRIPSVHYLAVVRLDRTTVLSIGLGPRSSLVARARLGRLLEPTGRERPLYRLSLAPTFSLRPPQDGVALFRREGWTARGERTVAMGDGARDVFAVVELGSAFGLLVRGALLVVLDAALLFGLGLVASWLWHGVIERPAWLPERRAFRTRIAWALALFFVVPAVGFALANILEIARDGQSRRDLMILQTLRDAAPTANLPGLRQGVPYDRVLEELAERVDANLVLYQDGRLRASNGSGVFEDFGAIDPLVDPRVFHRIAIHGEPTAVAAGPSAALPTRLGVRSVQLLTGDEAMLASPQSSADATITTQQLDLAYAMLLAVVGGLFAALFGAQLSARALSRPAADLRDAALAFGRGEALPRPNGRPPAEFEPVFAALEKMASDVRRTQEAQEQAARVLAWGEMANQIAHEIKNPLTPMRLGIQHLQRVQRDGRAPIGPTLEETSRRILGEIDRLDTIARAFSRFAAPADGRPAPVAVALAPLAREVAALYGLTGTGGVRVDAREDVPVLAHDDEVKEALINLLENSRNAGAEHTVIRIRGAELAVEDDGEGIPAEWLPRIFEPRFSTTTSGSGLGLAIVKRLVEGWGASIEVRSERGRGTVVTIVFRPSEGEAPTPPG
ncbi:MAG: ATP-binding protein [Gemmatimonadales bacterium]